MFTIQDQYETITLTKVIDYNPQTKMFIRDDSKKDVVFKNEKELIEFLANNVKTYNYDDPARWEFAYMDNQNLTGTDISYKYDMYKFDQYQESIYWWNQFVFWKDDGTIVDVRNYKDKVIKLIYARKSNLVKVERKSLFYRGRYWRYYHTHTRHTHCRYRSKVRYTRTLRNSYEFEYEDENVYYKYYPKNKDTQFRYMWYDDFPTKLSTGWKSKKYKKQWEHNVDMKFKHQQNKLKKEY